MDTSLQTGTAPRPGAWRELNDLTDDNLVERARRHDLAALEALMRRHIRRLFRITRSTLRDGDAAQKAMQEAYLQAFAKLDSYEPAGKFPAWLSKIALNEALLLRQQTLAAQPSVSKNGWAESKAVGSPSPEQMLEAAHARALLEHAVDNLPENFRMVFVLRVVQGLDVRETSESLGINPNTVRTRLFRAHRLLHGELARQLRTESSEVFDFGADRSDAVVAAVLARLTA